VPLIDDSRIFRLHLLQLIIELRLKCRFLCLSRRFNLASLVRLHFHLLLDDLGVLRIHLALGLLVALCLVRVVLIDGVLSPGCQLSTLQVAILQLTPRLRHLLDQEHFEVLIS
jgi:hypothetical protein